MDEILQAVEAQNRAFGEFKSNYESKIERLEAKMYNRPGNGASESRSALIGTRRTSLIGSTDPELKAFVAFLRTGDDRELKTLAVSTGSGTDGGFAVPKVIDPLIEDVLLNSSPIRRYAQVTQTASGDYHKLVNLRGFETAWVTELQSRPITATAKFVDLAPKICEMYSAPAVSGIMLDDAFFDVGSWLATELGIAFGETEDNAFLNGTGGSQPVGLLTAPTATTADATRAFGTVQYLATGVAGTFATPTASVSPADVLLQAIASMNPGYLQGAVWLMNSATYALFLTSKDLQGRFVVIPSIAAGELPTLLGYPVVLDQHMPPVAAGNIAIVFANLNRAFLIVDRKPIRILVDPYTARPLTTFYATKRVGATLLNSNALKFIKVAVS